MMEQFWSRRNIFTQNNTVILKWKGTSQKQWSIFKGSNYGLGSCSSKLNHVTLPETLRKKWRDKSQTERKPLKSNIWRELISRIKKEMSKLIMWKTASQYFSSVQFSGSVMNDSCWPHESQHARPPCPSPTPGVYPNSCPSSWWCPPTMSSSVVPFSSCPQFLPASGSFPLSQLFTWGGQSTGVSASASVLPMKTQDWSPLRWTGWISLQSKGLSRVFSNTTVQKHQFFGVQPSSQSNSHIHTWPQEKP